MPFLELLEAGLRARPERVLLVEDPARGGRSATAAALLARAGGLRQALRQAGVGPGDRVLLSAANSIDWVACDLACLGEGALLVPLDPRLEPAAVAAVARLCTPRLLLCDDPARGAGLDLPALRLDEAGGEGTWEPGVARGPSDDATIVTTSGSSGTPKGAVLTRGNLDFMIGRTATRLAALTGLGLGEEQALHYLPFCYAGSRILLHACLQRGARLQLVADPRRLADHLPGAAPDYFLNVPLVLERFRRATCDALAERGPWALGLLRRAEAAWAEAEEGRPPGLAGRAAIALARRVLLAPLAARFGPRLRGLICGSAPLAPECQRFFRLAGVEVYQGYGLTETTALCTLDEEGLVRPGWVGRPLPGVKLRRSPEGEVQTRGAHVFRGYWGDEAATAAALTEDGWFRTGDLGEPDVVGRWRITGRLSAVLVLQSGHNVPPEPQEEALRLALGDDAQVVLAGQGRPYLVALLAGSSLAREAVDAALARLNEGWPPHKRIRAFQLLPQPFSAENGLLTSNLKVRRGEVLARFAPELDRLYAAGPTVPGGVTGGAA